MVPLSIFFKKVRNFYFKYYNDFYYIYLKVKYNLYWSYYLIDYYYQNFANFFRYIIESYFYGYCSTVDREAFLLSLEECFFVLRYFFYLLLIIYIVVKLYKFFNNK